MPQEIYLALITTLQNAAYYLHNVGSENPYWHSKNLCENNSKKKKNQSLTTVNE